ncbi:serine/threonine-protein kinase par-1-like [Littorina saxatilis]|uniref:serine/threonine-protein kinase par-1-like n=1 Tax=Littorina saxatilis TaxID=31220 RepID=UPI0038B66345
MYGYDVFLARRELVANGTNLHRSAPTDLCCGALTWVALRGSEDIKVFMKAARMASLQSESYADVQFQSAGPRVSAPDLVGHTPATENAFLGSPYANNNEHDHVVNKNCQPSDVARNDITNANKCQPSRNTEDDVTNANNSHPTGYTEDDVNNTKYRQPSDVTQDVVINGRQPPDNKHDDVTNTSHPLDVTQNNVTNSNKYGLPVPKPDTAKWPTKGSRMWKQMVQDSESIKWHGIHLLEMLGGGEVSTVYLAENMNDSVDGKAKKVVIKVMNWTSVLGDYQRSVYPYLIKVYDNIPYHHNLLKTERRFVDTDTHFLLQEWCPHRSLAYALGPNGMYDRGMAEDKARTITHQMWHGLVYLKKHSLPHGRLTLENVLLDKDFKVKLCDYGYPPSTCSNRTDDDFHLRYRAPELLRGKPYTAFAADIWSLGVVVYAMLHSKMPYSVKEILDAERPINMPQLEFKTSLTYLCRMFLKKLMTNGPMFRPELSALITDAWMVEKPKPLAKDWHPSCHHDQEKGEPEEQTDGKPVNSETKADGKPVQKSDLEAKANGQSLRYPNSSDTTPVFCRNGCGRRAAQSWTWGQDKNVISFSDFNPPPPPSDIKWRKAYLKQLCEECYVKEMKRLFKENSGLPSLAVRRTHKLHPRVASMFAHYNPLPPELINGVPNAKKQDRLGVSSKKAKAKQRCTNEKIRDQLREFLINSERQRARFYRYHAQVIPPKCRQFPLPPVIIMSAERRHWTCLY